MSSEPMYNKSMSSPASGQDGRKLILSVDGQLGVLYSRYKLLSAVGYTVLCATDGVQALQIFGSNQVDLVLLDFMPQGTDGRVSRPCHEGTQPQRSDPDGVGRRSARGLPFKSEWVRPQG